MNDAMFSRRGSWVILAITVTTENQASRSDPTSYLFLPVLPALPLVCVCMMMRFIFCP